MTNIIYFVICRYVPSVLRGEKVNIGFVYHVPSLEQMDFIASKNIRRLKSFDDELEVDVINAIFESLKFEFGSDSLEQYEYEDEALDLSNPYLLNDKTSGYVNQIQFSEVNVFESQETLEKAIKDITDMILYFDKKKNERINQDRVRALAAKIVNSSSYKDTLTRFQRTNEFFGLPYDFKFNLNGKDKFIKAFSFEYKQTSAFFKEIKAYLYDLEHFVKEGLVSFSDVKIVINNTDLEAEHERIITRQLPKDLELITLEKFSSLIRHNEDSFLN